MVGVSLALPQDRWKAERDACGMEEYIITRAQARALLDHIEDKLLAVADEPEFVITQQE